MTHQIVFDSSVERQLHELPREFIARVRRKLHDAKQNPHYFFSRLVGREEYRMRVGDYHIIADIDDTNKVITVRIIGHRKNIYDRT